MINTITPQNYPKGFIDYVLVHTSKALFDSDLVATRITLALAEMCWFIMLAWPGETFGRPTYHVMSLLMSEPMWALTMLCTSIIQISIVLYGCLHCNFARKFAAFNAVLWVYLVSSMLISVYPPPAAIGGEIALMFSAIWVFIRPFILTAGYTHAIKTA